MRDVEVKLGSSAYTLAMPLGALEDLVAKGVDPLKIAFDQFSSLSQNVTAVKVIIDVAGAWGADPDKGRPPAAAHRLTFATVYDHPEGGLFRAVDIATAALMLAFEGAASESPPETPATS